MGSGEGGDPTFPEAVEHSGHWPHCLSQLWSDKPASALCAGSYNLTSVLPTAPDMAQFKQGVRSVAGKLSVFANGVMTSIQVSDAGRT